MGERELDVVLYGATGYTGRLIADELTEHDVDIGLAGRDQGKLDALAAELDGPQETIVASVEDQDALEAMASRTEVVISAAGPFKRLGPPVLRAAVKAGAHFVDITGEQTFLRWAYEKQDARARELGLTVVDAMGFDVIPSDLAAYHAAQGLEEVARLDLAILSDAKLSGGTRRSMAASTGDHWWYEDGGFQNGPPGRFLRGFEFPGSHAEGLTGVFIPWGDCVTAPRTTGADVVRTFFMLPDGKAKKMHWSWPLTGLISRLPWIDRLAESRAPESGQGPDREQETDARFAILAEAHDADGEVNRALVSGRDPYGMTGAAAARGGVAIAKGEVEEAGVLTPTQAFGPEWPLKALAEFEIEVSQPDA